MKNNMFPTAALTKIRLHSRLWPIVTILLLLLQLVWPSRAWMTLLIIVGGIWVVSFAWTYSLARHLFLERALRYGWAQVGDQLEERFIIINDSILPALWLEVDDQSNMPDYTAGRVTSVGGNTSLEWKTSGICTRRGLFTLGPTTLRSGDPLGLCSLEIQQPNSTILLVLPPVLPLPPIEIAAGGRTGEGRRPRRSAMETTVSVETVREYAPGDPLKAIHWPTSAKKDALFVRQFEHTPSADWWIFLDLEQSVQMGEGSASTTEHGIIMAASLADRGIRQGHSVGLVTCGRELTWIPPQRTSGHLMNMLRTLALVQPGELPLAELLKSAQESIHRDASMIIVTPNLKGDWAAPMLQLIRKGIAPTVLLFDPESFGKAESATGVLTLLADFSITHNIIHREMLDRAEARPGTQGKWEWRVTGRGKAVAIRRPVDTGWRQLG
jgi:uncharacterized protein (DUF58 family)